jgi:hypothetical protein
MATKASDAAQLPEMKQETVNAARTASLQPLERHEIVAGAEIPQHVDQHDRRHCDREHAEGGWVRLHAPTAVMINPMMMQA